MRTRLKKLFRKIKHQRYVDAYINELRWECLNVILAASATQWTNKTIVLLDNNAKLIRKYERRRRWLKF